MPQNGCPKHLSYGEDKAELHHKHCAKRQDLENKGVFFPFDYRPFTTAGKK